MRFISISVHILHQIVDWRLEIGSDKNFTIIQQMRTHKVTTMLCYGSSLQSALCNMEFIHLIILPCATLWTLYFTIIKDQLHTPLKLKSLRKMTLLDPSKYKFFPPTHPLPNFSGASPRTPDPRTQKAWGGQKPGGAMSILHIYAIFGSFNATHAAVASQFIVHVIKMDIQIKQVLTYIHIQCQLYLLRYRSLVQPAILCNRIRIHQHFYIIIIHYFTLSLHYTTLPSTTTRTTTIITTTNIYNLQLLLLPQQHSFITYLFINAMNITTIFM